ncbi:MAG: c-type cytochrome [Betaproteobacteria bacterium]
MKYTARATLATLAVGFLIVAGQAHANEELAVKSGCTGCHKVDAKLVGPSYKEVAAKYKGDKKAEATLIAKVKNGGTGVWGAIPMPANTAVKDEDIKVLVKWILALK